MAEEAQKEPTMEEILASIRKIISEDDDSRPASAQAQFRTVEPETDDTLITQPRRRTRS